MSQDMMEDQCSRDITESKDVEADRPRALTYDETKAAEAAFRGEPLNPAWSAAAAKVYAGIVSAMNQKQTADHAESDVATDCIASR